jgi:prepilin-type N-terminal cleavage/methylation domain-containing protein
MRRQAGVTLLEVLVAVTLLSLLAVGMMFALRIGLFAFSRTNSRLMDDRRVAGSQRIIEQELQGLMPVVGPCGGDTGGGMGKTVLFQGQPDNLTMISTFSLQQAWRGRPQILQFFVAGDDEGGIRLLVNEIPYTGPIGAGALCTNATPDPGAFATLGHFPRPAATPTSFVLADHLSRCQFSYLTPSKKPGEPGEWVQVWAKATWPAGIRIEMVPLHPSPARLQPITVTAPIYVNRAPEIQYADR